MIVFCEVVDARFGRREGLKPGEVKRGMAVAVAAGWFWHRPGTNCHAGRTHAAYIMTQCYIADGGGNVMSW